MAPGSRWPRASRAAAAIVTGGRRPPPSAPSWRRRAAPAAARPGLAFAGLDPAVDRALASSVEGTPSAGGWVSAYRNLASYQTRARRALGDPAPAAGARGLRARVPDHARHGDRRRRGAGLALALGAFFARRLTRPLAALARRADAIAAGSAETGPPVGGPGEIGALGHRIEEMARRIAERAELQALLARGDRLATVGVMSAQVAHEINNPLTTVLGYAKLLQEDKPEGHPDRAALEMIASEAERMKTIVGGLLEYARTPRPPARPGATARELPPPTCELAAVVRHVGALLEPQLRRTRTRLEVDVAAPAPAAPAPPAPLAIEAHALQQVLVNLVQNSLQAMAEAGRAGTIAITARPAPGNVATIITISDDGPGIPEADRARIFDPFFTTKAAGAGTGLGLAVCKHLIATAGGTIEAAARPDGRGAELRLVIPNAA